MMLAYRYRARARGDRMVSGMVLASGRDVAIETLRSNGLEPTSLSVSLNYSVEASRRRTFRQDELALFYETLAAQYDSGVLEQLILGSTEFVRDKLLITALETLAQRLAFHGGSLGREMAACGFPPTHCAAIESAATSGKLPEVLRSLSEDCHRNSELGDEMQAALFIPAIAMLIIILGIWASLCFLAPMMKKLWGSLSSVKAKDASDWLQLYMSFIEWIGDHRALFTLAYLGAWIAVAAILFSPPVRRLFLRVPLVRNLRERSEMLRQWSLWRAFYESGESIAVASRKLVANCELETSRQSFTELARLLENGYPVAEAVRISRFPTYIQNGVAAAFKRNDGAANGIHAMVRRLAHEVNVLTRQLKDTIRTVAPLTLGFGVILLFAATMLPNMAMVGSLLKHGVGQ